MSTENTHVSALNEDALAQEIRRVDGDHTLGASALAEALMPFLTAASPGEEAALWCLHVLGPDDVHPAPSKEHAERAAERFNAHFGPIAEKTGVMCKAVAEKWPHSAASHADSVEHFCAEWLAQAAQPQLAGEEAVAWSALCPMCKKTIDDQEDDPQEVLTLAHHDLQPNASLGADVCAVCGLGAIAAAKHPCRPTPAASAPGGDQAHLDELPREQRDPWHGGNSYEASMLRNLLARIHRDGGHYVENHGLEKALDDAEATIVSWLSHADDEARDAARYRWLRDNAKPWDHISPLPYARIRIVMSDDEDGSTEFGIIGTRSGVGIVTLDIAVDAAIAKGEAT